MAAYAAALSLMHSLDLIENHPSPPISLDKQQFDSLTEIVTFLQEFLEVYVSPFSNSDEADRLEMHIAEAVHAAEDVIESYIVDNIHLTTAAASTTTAALEDDVMESYTVDSIQLAAAAVLYEGEQIRYLRFYEGLQKVIKAMDMIEKEATEFKPRLPRNVSAQATGFRSSSGTESKSEMVGFDDELLQLKERLVGGNPSRQIIPIVGMGGIGKTTLARNVFVDKLIKEHFDICMWATISQDHNIEQTLIEVLSQSQRRGNSSGDKSVEELGEQLHKYLFGRRYLAVLDDMWSIEVWDNLRFFFPDCGEGSRIIVTTRISNLAAHLTSSSNSLCMSFLNEVDSRTLFSKTVFGSEGSNVPELGGIGKKIVEKCKGLPLSIVVIGGLLARTGQTQEYWEYIEENLSSIVNLENEEYCLRVLKLSYNHLPAYLKPCFLYMGVFDEDSEIKVSTIIKLWVSEGFIKSRKEKSLETVAREYFHELVGRNLLLDYDEASSRRRSFSTDGELGCVGMTKLCKMHDLVRDLSLREAQKQSFYYVYDKHNHPSSNPHRRIVVPHNTVDANGSRIMLESSSNHRSYVFHDNSVRPSLNFRLLRTLHTTDSEDYYRYSQKEVFGLVNSRLLAIAVEREWPNNVLHSSISRLWSLHTLLVYSFHDLEGPVEFWKMHQLKHVEFTRKRLRLQLPPDNDINNIVIMEKLHTLIGVKDFHLNENVVTRIPNLRILDVYYEKKLVNREVHCLSYLQSLSKLESFRCFVQKESGENMQRISFPQSLNQVLLLDDYDRHQIEWEDIFQKVGRLPHVEELKIQYGVFKRGEWEITEGQFPRLKTLELVGCASLEKWTVSEGSSSLFPLLEKLLLVGLEGLVEIPSEIGEIATLKSIELRFCCKSAVLSAKKIVLEQEDSYGEEQLSFRVRVHDHYDRALENLASLNFQVELH